MTNSERAAHSCLAAASATLTLMTVRDENFELWLTVLRDILPKCESCPDPMIPLRVFAGDLVKAEPGKAQNKALTMLQIETHRYFAMAAAHRFKTFQAAQADDAQATTIAEAGGMMA